MAMFICPFACFFFKLLAELLLNLWHEFCNNVCGKNFLLVRFLSYVMSTLHYIVNVCIILIWNVEFISLRSTKKNVFGGCLNIFTTFWSG
jgi:hypothetical protein